MGPKLVKEWSLNWGSAKKELGAQSSLDVSSSRAQRFVVVSGGGGGLHTSKPKK